MGEIKYKPANAARSEVASRKGFDKAKGVLEIVGTSLASFAVIIAFIAAFCLRVTAVATGDDLTSIVGQAESESIFYYFGRAYADIADILAGMPEYNGVYATGLYVSTALNTVVGIAMLVCVIVGTIMSIIAFVKFMTHKTDDGNLCPAVFTVVSQRKYYRVHIAYLIMILTMKQSISISDVQKILPADSSEDCVWSVYEAYSEKFRQLALFFN